MLQLPDAGDAFLAADLFEVIAGMDAGNPQASMRAVIESRWGDVMRGYTAYAATNTNPAAVFASTTSKVILVLRGVSAAYHIPYVMLSTMNGEWNNPSLPYNYFADTSSEWFMNNLFDEAIPGSRDVVILGHSYGGGVAIALAQKLRNTRPNTRVRLIQIGPPRVCKANIPQFMANVDNVLWMNDGDAVPSIMPTEAEAFPVQCLYTPKAAAFAASRGQLRNCNIIDMVTYGVTPAVAPSRPIGMFPLQGILNWAFYLEAFTHEFHSRSSYSNSLRGVTNRLGARQWGEAAAVPVAVGVGHSLSQGPTLESIDGTPWTDTMPSIGIAQGMEVVSTPPPAIAGLMTSVGRKTARKKEIIVEGISIGEHHRGTIRRSIRRTYARLKRLCSRVDVFFPGTLAGLVSKWPVKP